MLLIYSDEAGTNYKKDDKTKFFNDGPFLIWVGILVPEIKYFHLERMFYDLINEIFGIKDLSKVEMHAHDVWHGNTSRFKPKKKRQQYFEELFQLIKKLEINIVVALEQKTQKNISKYIQKKEKERCMYTFLHGLEHQLSRLNQTGVLISDEVLEPGKEDPEVLKRYGDKTILERLFKDRVEWRYNPGSKRKSIITPKYSFESKSSFLLDRPHYVNSKDSLFIQIADHVVYVCQRVFTYEYLKVFSNNNNKFPTPDISKVPISISTLQFLYDNFFIGSYDHSQQDIMFIDKTSLYPQKGDRFINPNLVKYISSKHI